MMEKCNICKQDSHFCEGMIQSVRLIGGVVVATGEPHLCGNITGHYGKSPAKLCDDCRHLSIIETGTAGDEPFIPDGSDFKTLAKWIVTGDSPQRVLDIRNKE